MEERSLARLVYETRRSLEGRAHQVEKKRGKRGYVKPDHPRTKGGVRGAKKGDQAGRYGGRERRKISEQSLIEEIEGTGILGPAESADLRERARKRLEELGGSLAGGLSSLAGRIASKRATQSGRQ